MQIALLRNKWFVLGLVLRLIAVAFLLPVLWRDLFIPFTSQSLIDAGLDPWSYFTNMGGRADAFPYGLPMYIWYAAGTLFGGWLGNVNIGFGLGVLAADLGLFLVLCRYFNNHLRPTLWLYWLSPIVLAIVYWHGQLDIFPTMLLFAGLYYFKKQRPLWAAVLLATACASKLSMLIPIPFIIFYAWRHPVFHRFFIRFIGVFAVVFCAWQIPLLYAPAYHTMVFGTPEIGRLFDATIRIGDNSVLYLLPIIFAGLLFWFTRYNRLSFDMLLAFISLAFSAILILTDAPPGWYVWILPIFVLVGGDRLKQKIVPIIQWLIAVLAIGYFSGAHIYNFADDFGRLLDTPIFTFASLPPIENILRSLISVCLALYGWSVWRNAITNSTFHRLRWQPLAIGIAGDSGTGKDTLSAAITKIFGADAVASLSGDDYHKYERGAPMWRAVTHLDPRGNNLDLFQSDALRLMNGENIVARHYDHTVGRFTRARGIVRNDVVIISGLHAVFSPVLRDRYDLTIFLDMDEKLRRALKLHRDVNVRSQSPDKVIAAIERRLDDAQAFIKPQSQYADVIFSVAAVDDADLAPDRFVPEKTRMRLNVTLRDGTAGDGLTEMLIGLCGLHVESSYGLQDGSLSLSIDGDINSDDIALAVRYARLGLDDLIIADPIWHDGTLGVMQLISLVVINNALLRRGGTTQHEIL